MVGAGKGAPGLMQMNSYEKDRIGIVEIMVRAAIGRNPSRIWFGRNILKMRQAATGAGAAARHVSDA
jgi:hypothetical protein